LTFQNPKTKKKKKSIKKFEKNRQNNCLLVVLETVRTHTKNLYRLFMNKMFIVHMYSSVESDLLIPYLRCVK